MGGAEPTPLPNTRQRPALRCPLFFPALCFAGGCWLGGLALPLWAFGLAALAALGAWFGFRARPVPSAAACYLFCLCAAFLHARLPEVYLAPTDLRSLPEAKFATPVWEGAIAGPAEFRPGKRAPDTGRARFTLAVDRWNGGGGWAPARGRVEASIEATTDRWRSGQRLRLTGPLAVPATAPGPGQFDPRSFFAVRQIHYEVRAADSDVEMIGPGHGAMLAGAFAQGADAVRRWGVRQLQLGVEDDPLPSSIAASFILGRRDLVPPAVLSSFRATGTYHLFAVSAVNMGVLLALALAAFRLSGLIRWRWGWLLAPLLFFYALASGGHPSVVRAFLSSTLILVAWGIGRPVPPLHLWSITVLALLAWFPEAALDLGFQFSFGVVLALIVLAAPIARWLERPLALDPFIPLRLATPGQRLQSWGNRFVGGLLGGCLAAWVGSLVLEAAYFHQLCLASVPANLVAIPLAGLIFTVGAFSLAGGLISPVLPVLFNNANWLFAKVLLAAVTFLAHLPAASLYFPPGGALGRDREPQFLVMPAGYGTSVLIRHRGAAWLVNPSDEKGFFYTIEPTRKYMGVNRLGGLILSQWTAAEAGAAALVPDALPTGPLWAPPVEGKKPGHWADPLHPQTWTAGLTQALDPELSVTVLSPGPDSGARAAADRGLVLLFDYHGARFLYAGHIGFGIEQRIAAGGGDPRAAVLAEGRHGTEMNLTPEWLRAVGPHDLLLIGEQSPTLVHQDPLLNLPEEGRPRLWRSAEAGAVAVTLHGDGTATVAPWNGMSD